MSENNRITSSAVYLTNMHFTKCFPLKNDFLLKKKKHYYFYDNAVIPQCEAPAAEMCVCGLPDDSCSVLPAQISVSKTVILL